MVKTPKAFREFFLDDLPKLQAELIAAAQTDFADWLESDEYLSLRAQTRQRWLKAGIDIDRHPDPIGQLRLLIAKANPATLAAAGIDWPCVMDSPPREWFASLFEAACQAQTTLEAAGTGKTDCHPLSPPKENWPGEPYARNAIIRLKETPELQENVSAFCKTIAEEQGVPEIATSLRKLLYQSKYKELWKL